MSTWVVTGGAGYIGSHVVHAFLEAGIPVSVVDDLSTGLEDNVPNGVPLEVVDIRDTGILTRVLQKRDVQGVVHLAGFKFAGVSVSRPLHTYRQNVEGTVSLLEAMERTGVDNLVFSSSAAVYGTPRQQLVDEATPTSPESPYGESKLIGEWLVAAQAQARGLAHTSLRYFNVVGSGPAGIADRSEHNLFPLAAQALASGRTPRIYGDDYDTPDGTCIRDYVHVADVAAAHVRAALALEQGRTLREIYNLGSGRGTSVREIMDAFARVSGIGFQPEIHPRRPGDPDRIVADGAAAAEDLEWAMTRTVDEMVESAWRASQT